MSSLIENIIRTEDHMPRPILKNRQNQQMGSGHSLEKKNETGTSSRQMSKTELDRLLRKPRSKEYMEAMRKLDIGSHVLGDAQRDEIIRILQEEFPEVQLGGILVGIVAKCYIGPEYDVHSINMSGGIIHHFQKNESMPPELAKARALAARGTYEFIEVYHDCCRCVSADGSVAVI
jgi:hypothetical protein